MQQQTAERDKVGVPSQGTPTPHIPLRTVLLHRYVLFLVACILILVFIDGRVKSADATSGVLTVRACWQACGQLPAPVQEPAYISRVVENVAV